MPFFPWTEQFSVRVAAIDSQHKNLVNMVNQIHDAMQARRGNEFVRPILNSMISYTQSHFATEENLMREHDYPGYFEHKKEHDALAQKATDLVQKFNRGDIVITQHMTNFLKNWLTHHISGTDKAYSDFFNAKGIH